MQIHPETGRTIKIWPSASTAAKVSERGTELQLAREHFICGHGPVAEVEKFGDLEKKMRGHVLLLLVAPAADAQPVLDAAAVRVRGWRRAAVAQRSAAAHAVPAGVLRVGAREIGHD